MVSVDTTQLCVVAIDHNKPMGLWLCSNKTLLNQAAGHIWPRGLHVLTCIRGAHFLPTSNLLPSAEPQSLKTTWYLSAHWLTLPQKGGATGQIGEVRKNKLGLSDSTQVLFPWQCLAHRGWEFHWVFSETHSCGGWS